MASYSDSDTDLEDVKEDLDLLRSALGSRYASVRKHHLGVVIVARAKAYGSAQTQTSVTWCR